MSLNQSENYTWSTADVLGQGATGAVYVCRHKKTGDCYAAKVLAHNRLNPYPMREFEVLKKLRHQNVVGIIGAEEEQGTRKNVIIMELCTGGSLYTVLEDPTNAYGLDEGEFFCVLRDITFGLQHLRSKEVVHRDIKPGNILRFITADGRSMYKLTDFGAAKELPEEEQFMSLCGTEEYLHPDIYGRAVLQNFQKQRFEARVDLWSLGVTLFHVACGHLPFIPYGGRRGRDTMYFITTEKDLGVISGIQRTPNGPIEYSKTLPRTCLLSQGMKDLLTPILAGLMEHNPSRMWTFDKYFTEAINIIERTVVYVFSVWTWEVLHIYLNKSDNFGKMQENIAKQTGINPAQQFMLYEGSLFSDLVSVTDHVDQFPVTSTDRPIILFPKEHVILPRIIPEIPPLPESDDNVNVESDYQLSKSYNGIAHFIHRQIKRYVLFQSLLDKSIGMYLQYMVKDVVNMKMRVDLFLETCDELAKRAAGFKDSHLLTSRLLSMAGNNNIAAWDERVLRCYNTVEELKRETEKMKRYKDEYYKRLVENKELHRHWVEKETCNDACFQKVKLMAEDISHVVEDFRNDRKHVRLRDYEVQNHKIAKRKMIQLGQKIASQEKSCYDKITKVHKEVENWCLLAYRIKNKVQSLGQFVEQVRDMKNRCSKDLDETQGPYNHFVDELIQGKPISNNNPPTSVPVNKSPGQDTDQLKRKKSMLKQITDGLSAMKAESLSTKEILTENCQLLEKLQELQIANNQIEAEVMESMRNDEKT